MKSGKSKIIMFDDSEANSTVGKRILDSFFEVYPALTSGNFFKLLEKITPDLILLDMELPELDGDETIQKIKFDNRFADIPVILLAPESGKPSRLEGFKLGAADCIAKPFSGPFLLKRIIKQLLIVEKDKVTAAGGKAAAKVVKQLNARAGKKRKGGGYAY